MRLFKRLVGGMAAVAIATGAYAQGQPDSYSFIEAVKKGDGNAASQLLREHPTVVNARDGNGDTGLIIAARKREPEWVGFMLHNGADPDLAGAGGDTALIAASRIGFEDAVRWLIDRDARIDANNKLGETALIVAVQQRRPAVVKLLLAAGANPDKGDFSGYSARDYAKRDTRNRQLAALIDGHKRPK